MTDVKFILGNGKGERKMVDGTYEVVARTPMGARKAKVTLSSGEGRCEASVTVGNKRKSATGSLDGDAFSFSGTVSSPLGKIPYQLEGTADGVTLDATARTKRGTVSIHGNRA